MRLIVHHHYHHQQLVIITHYSFRHFDVSLGVITSVVPEYVMTVSQRKVCAQQTAELRNDIKL